MSLREDLVVFSEEVLEARKSGQPLVALETSVWCQGLPHPFNLETAKETDAQVRLAGAVPALFWLENGKVHCGAGPTDIERLCTAEGALKVGAGDIPGTLMTGALGATTVSGTLPLADHLGIQVFATGGIGGVHKGWVEQLDVSADLHQLSRTRCLTVCSGAKSVIDIPTTLEQLESRAIPLLTFRTDNFPEFYTAGKKAPFGSRCDEPEHVAQAYRLSLEVMDRAPLLVQEVPSEYAISEAEMKTWVEAGTALAQEEKVEGKALTPFLLSYMAEQSEGRTLDTNRVLLLHNAYLAGQIAVALAESQHRS